LFNYIGELYISPVVILQWYCIHNYWICRTIDHALWFSGLL